MIPLERHVRNGATALRKSAISRQVGTLSRQVGALKTTSLVGAVEGLPEIAEVSRVDEMGALVPAAVAPNMEATEIGAAKEGIIGF